MRFLLAALIALHAPVSAAAAVVAEMPAVGRLTPALAAPALAPATLKLAPSLAAPSLSATLAPALSAPAAAFAPTAASAAEPSAVPAAAVAAEGETRAPAAMTNLRAVGAAVSDPKSGEAALGATFDFSRATAADDSSAPRAADAAQAPALKPASPRRASPWRSAVPNALTMSNMASGLAAAFLASSGKFVPAALAIIAANLFDALDGRAARALKSESPLGIDLDSLADVVSFGAAPALLIFKAALLPALGWWGFPIAAAFAAGGLYRLARFNVGAHAEKSGAAAPKKSDSFTGLPIPGGAGVIVALTLALSRLPAPAVAPVAVVVTLLAAAAMVSRLPYPAFKKKGLAVAAVAGLAAAAVPAALGLYDLIPAAVFGLYLAAGPAVRLLRR